MVMRATRELLWIGCCLNHIRNRVIEGAVIAAKAVGATQGFFYIRANTRWRETDSTGAGLLS